jgi:hypothetical protein
LGIGTAVLLHPHLLQNSTPRSQKAHRQQYQLRGPFALNRESLDWY